MCGRYATTRSSVDLSAFFEALDETAGGLTPDYNVAPTDPVPVVRVSRSRGERVLQVARWGLVPHWARDARAGARMINARAETVTSSSAYAPAFAKRRCLVPADGWYEWVRTGTTKQPYFMTSAEPLAFAGLWAVWGPDSVLTCSVVTTAALGDLAAVHDRMPLLLPPDRWRAWLSEEDSAVEALLAPPPEPYLARLELRPVGPAVGDVRNDGPHLIQRVPGPPLLAPPEPPAELTLF